MQLDRGIDQQCVYVFGYGSLIDPKSASHTSSQPITREQMKTVWLQGYRRAWSVHAEARIDEHNETSTHPIAFLNIEPDIARRCNGVLLKIPPTDLPRFDRRERVYERVNVTDQISPTPDATVYAYVGRSPYTNLPPETKVAAGYENLVRNAAKQWGDSFLEAYEATTEPHQLPKFTEAYEVVGPDTVATVRG